MQRKRRAYEAQFEFLVKRLPRYVGARSCKDLKTIISDSSAISCSMVLNPNISISLLGVPKLLVVKLLAALC